MCPTKKQLKKLRLAAALGGAITMPPMAQTAAEVTGMVGTYAG